MLTLQQDSLLVPILLYIGALLYHPSPYSNLTSKTCENIGVISNDNSGDSPLWKVGDQLPSHNESCMVCGPKAIASPIVEHWTLRADERVGARICFDERHQGAPAYAHGGAVAAVLDDAIGYLSFVVVQMFVTAHLQVDYRRPTLLGHTYDVEAWVTSIEGRKVYAASELRDERGPIAEVSGLMIIVDLDHFRP